jgi:predicted AlkP superfamily pyrophosphatase or phosphodiesterase
VSDPAPTPLLPAFGGACLTGVVPGLLGHLYGGDPLPGWMPEGIAGAPQVVLLVLDGLGWQQLAARRTLAPTLAAAQGEPITSVAPSTTACALTSLVTGRPPAEHGIVGYRLALGGRVMNVLQWTVGEVDARVSVRPDAFQPCALFPGAPGRVPVVTRYDYTATGFSAAHLGGAAVHAWYTPAGLVTGVRSFLAQGARFVYAYYEGIDKVAHARGLGDDYDDELRATDRLVSDVLSVLPPGAVLVATADHGQVDVGNEVEVLGPDVMAGVTLLSGEGRFRWLHTHPGAVSDVTEAATATYKDVAWVRTREQVVAEGWLGGELAAGVADRLGDVVLVPHAPTAFLDPADTGELRLVARHGSLTADEMLIPLLSWPSR